MNRVIVHDKLEPALSFFSSANRVVIHHTDPLLTITGSKQVLVKSKTTKKVKMLITNERIIVKQRDDKKNLKAVR
jgi:hypothetical protein